MKKSILFATSLLAIFGTISCNKTKGQLPKSLKVTSTNSEVMVTNQFMNDFGFYLVTVKCNTPNMYFREGIYYYEDYQVKIGNDEKKGHSINKRISLNEIEFKFTDTEVGGKDVEIEVTAQNAIKTFNEFNYTGKITSSVLDASSFTISAFNESATFNIIKRSDVDTTSVWEIQISCRAQLDTYGTFNPSFFDAKDWNNDYKVGEEIPITFKWFHKNSDFQTYPITFNGYGLPVN